MLNYPGFKIKSRSRKPQRAELHEVQAVIQTPSVKFISNKPETKEK